MKFTTNEWEILLHRLEATDAIVEVLTDDNDDLDPVKLTDDIELLIFAGHDRTAFNEQEILILRECCEGSTWFAGMDDAVARGEMTQGQANGYTRAANRLEDRFNVTIPRA